MGVEQKTVNKGIYASYGIPKTAPIQPISSVPIERKSLASQSLTLDYFFVKLLVKHFIGDAYGEIAGKKITLSNGDNCIWPDDKV